jgi:hypothetical protein
MSKSTKSKKVLKVLKELDTVWHPESTLVFKSQTEKKVTGRYDNGEFIELDDTALNLCEEYGFKYDQELYDQLYKEESDEAKEDEEVIDETKLSDVVDTTTDVLDTATVVVDTVDTVETTNDVVDNTVHVVPEPTTLVKVEKVNTKVSLVKDTEDLIDKHNKYFTEFTTSYLSSIKKLTEDNTTLSNNLDKTEKELANKIKEFNELTEKYEIIKKKFDTMKSIFS